MMLDNRALTLAAGSFLFEIKLSAKQKEKHDLGECDGAI